MVVTLPRHQCLIYDGAPSRQLPVLASAIRDMLQENYQCLYLNSPPMVAGLRSYLAAIDVDVAEEMARGSLVLTAEQNHLNDGKFSAERMMQSLEQALKQALNDGYAGLWATGDMSWEMGPARDFSQLLRYERLLEDFFQTHPQLSGVCQYHAETMPREGLGQGLIAHRSLFINETLSVLNPHYVSANVFRAHMLEEPHLETAVRDLCRGENVA